MATLRQKRAAKLVVENLQKDTPLTGGEIVENSGYGPSMKKNPQVILESEGVKEELERLGFSEEKAKEVVGSILSSEEEESKDRLKAAEMVFKVHGSFKESEAPRTQGATYNFLFSAETQAEVKAIEDRIKARLTQNHAETNTEHSQTLRQRP